MIITENKIGGYNQSNSPYILALYLINKNDIFKVLDPVRHIRPGGILSVLPYGGLLTNTNAVIHRMKFPPNSCTMADTRERTDGGVVHKFIIDFPMPGIRQDVDEFYLQNMEAQFVALAELANGKAYIIGNEERALRMAMIQSVSAINEMHFTLSATLTFPAFLLSPVGEGINLTAMFPETDFSIEFSLDFNA